MVAFSTVRRSIERRHSFWPNNGASWPGVGNTQLYLMLSVMAAMPTVEGFNRSVIYIDTEHKFSSGRVMEIAQTQFPELSRKTEVVQQVSSSCSRKIFNYCSCDSHVLKF